jgi:hypothetical protein
MAFGLTNSVPLHYRWSLIYSCFSIDTSVSKVDAGITARKNEIAKSIFLSICPSPKGYLN